jgi:hypothetical protein
MEAAAQEVAMLRDACHAEMLLSPDTPPAAALDELAALDTGLGRAKAEVSGCVSHLCAAATSCAPLASPPMLRNVSSEEVALSFAPDLHRLCSR